MSDQSTRNSANLLLCACMAKYYFELHFILYCTSIIVIYVSITALSSISAVGRCHTDLELLSSNVLLHLLYNVPLFKTHHRCFEGQNHMQSASNREQKLTTRTLSSLQSKRRNAGVLHSQWITVDDSDNLIWNHDSWCLLYLISMLKAGISYVNFM